MNVLDLVRSWPSLRAMTPADVLAAPAWRFETEFEGKEALLRRLAEGETEELLLSLSFDDEPHVLGLRDSAHYPDLHSLWSKRAALPPNLVLALVEKECGGVLQLLENLSRQEVKLVGLADRVTSAARAAFALASGTGDLAFSLDLPAGIADAFGQIECLDPNHPSIRALTRPVRAHYALLDLPAEEAAQLRAGDFLMLDGVDPRWVTGLPADSALHLMSAAETTVSFADFADDKLPGIPALEKTDLSLVSSAREPIAVELSQVGTASALRIK